jgi:hypothetical protein
MRKLWTASALALGVAAASPVFAQSMAPDDYGTRANDSVSRYEPAGHSRHIVGERGYGAYAYEPAPGFGSSSSDTARCTLSPADINYLPCTSR